MTSTTSARATGAAINTTEPARAAADASAAVRFRYDTVPLPFLFLTGYQIGPSRYARGVEEGRHVRAGTVGIRRVRGDGGGMCGGGSVGQPRTQASGP
ncbi:hypothetical protein GCM10010244_80880 [Streptomyces coeruleorubidus]|nr:hypothetical protein GCM10010244_80880 [Streptomyces bellus]